MKPGSHTGILVAVVGAGLITALAGAPQLPAPSPVPVADYVQYWAASRVAFAGGNPYDWNALLAAEQRAEPSMRAAVMMWNPPWTLTLMALPAQLPYLQSRAAWAIFSGAMLAFSAGLLWRHWGGRSRLLLPVLVAALCVPPSVFALVMGQISPLMLFGITGFLYCERRGHLTLAGAAAALTLVKPQVVYLFWACLVIWSMKDRRWRVLAGAAASLAALSAVPLFSHPGIFGDYLEAVRTRPPVYFVTPTFGTVLRLLAGWERTWLIYVPVFIGLGWLAVYWRAHQQDWRWSKEIALVLLLSVVTSPYVWLFDQVILFPVMLEVAANAGRGSSRGARRALWLYASAIAVSFVMLPWNVSVRPTSADDAGLLLETLTGADMFWHVTIAPALLAGYLDFRRQTAEGG